MTVSLLDLSRFVRRGMAAQSAVDSAIARADLVSLVRERQRHLQAIRLQRDDDVTDAQLRLGAAQAALEEFDHFEQFVEAEGRAPA